MNWDESIKGATAGPFDTEVFMGALQAAFGVKPVYFSKYNKPLCSGYVHTRLMLRKKLYLNNIISVETETFDRIREYARAHGIETILGSMFAQWDYDTEKYGIVKINPACTSVIDLTKPEEALLQSMKKPFRNAISKAVRSGLTATQSDDYDSFYEMYVGSQERLGEDKKDVKPYDRRMFDNFVAPMAKHGYAKLFLARNGEDIINGAVIACFNGRAFYWHGGMVQEGRNLGGGNLLHWEIIKHFKAAGFTVYDLGGLAVGPEISEHKRGINNFKESMGGIRKEYYMGQIST